MSLSPGPWRYDEKLECVVDDHGLAVVAALDPTEQTHSDDLVLDASPDDWKAIAATPKLLEACKTVLRKLKTQMKYVSEDRMAAGHNSDAQEILEDAIKEAENTRDDTCLECGGDGYGPNENYGWCPECDGTGRS